MHDIRKYDVKSSINKVNIFTFVMLNNLGFFRLFTVNAIPALL